VVEAMREIGIDLSSSVPTAMADTDVRTADLIVTMGCGDACPVYPGKRYEDWDLDDPADQSLAKIREIRDTIKRRVETLTAELLSSTPPVPEQHPESHPT
jgi:arsenate reductase